MAVTTKHGFAFHKEGFHKAKLVEDTSPLEYKTLWPHQARFLKELQHEPYWFIVGPPAAGKTLTIAALLTTKLEEDPELRAIIAVPQTIIGGGFEDNRFKLGKQEVFFDPATKLHNPSDSSNTSQLKRFLRKKPTSPVNDRVLICTHQTLVHTYKKFSNLFINILVVIDEAHHSKAAEEDSLSNRLGCTVSGLVERREQIGLATATVSRADGGELLGPHKGKFVVSECPFDDYLKVCRWFKSFDFNFLLYEKDLFEPVDRLLGDKRKRPPKTIVHIPNVHSSCSLGKYVDLASVYRGIAGGKNPEVRNPLGKDDGITHVKRGSRWIRVVNLVSEQNRDVKKQTIIAAHNDPNADRVDMIVALDMFKEGANWRWAENSIIIGYRGSFPELAQMVGRGLRDAPQKYCTSIHYVLSSQEVRKDADSNILNDYLKALLFVLLLEDVFKPVEIRVLDKKTRKRRRVRTDLLSEAVGYDLIEKLRIESLVIEVLLGYEPYRSLTAINSIAQLLEREGTYHKWASLHTIARQIVGSHLRRARLLARHVEDTSSRLEVSDIDVDLLRKSKHPLTYLMYYVKEIGLSTLSRLREALHSCRSLRWDSWYKLLQEFIEEYDRLPTQSECYKNVALGSWASRQRAAYKQHQLTPIQIEALESLPSWKWVLYNIGKESYDLLIKFVEQKKRFPEKDESYRGFKLGQWMRTQLENYHKMRLSSERIQLLEKLPDWSWRYKCMWEKYYLELRLYIENCGSPPSSRSEWWVGPFLWLRQQQIKHREDQLSPCRVELMERLHPDIWKNEGRNKWYKTYREVQRFYAVHGRPPDWATSVDGSEEHRFGIWCSTQRFEHTCKSLWNNQIKSLELLPGWYWDPTREEHHWDSFVSLVKIFVNRHNRFPLPSDEYPFNKSAEWMNRQLNRQQNKLAEWVSQQQAEYHKGQLSDRRIQSLKRLPGWVWTPEKGKSSRGSFPSSPPVYRYTSPKKQRARSKTIIEVYREVFQHKALPEGKQYWSMPAQCVNNNGQTGELIPHTELHQLVKAKLIEPWQFHGVDHSSSVFKANCLYNYANWYHADFYDALSEAVDDDPEFNPGIVNVDTISEPRRGVELFGKVLDRLVHVRDVLFVGNFIVKNRGNWHTLEELVETLRNDPKFKHVAPTLEWDKHKALYTYYGSTKGARTVMSTVMVWR